MNLMMRAAAVAASAIPAAAQDDPIFAAIEAHRAAVASFSDAVSANGRLERELPKDRRQWSCTPWEPELPADCADDPRWIASELEITRSHDAIEAAALELVNVPPATKAGTVALLSYVAETCRVDDGEWQFPPLLVDDDETERPFIYFVLTSATAALAA
jgi:hypothetical protein